MAAQQALPADGHRWVAQLVQQLTGVFIIETAAVSSRAGPHSGCAASTLTGVSGWLPNAQCCTSAAGTRQKQAELLISGWRHW